ncbi:YceD family protein [Salmonirosea aquatica]|uniref:YceD family protein n=1 Tax=Salmonirosea aquatica TaxID=2654236 RepID=UPI00357118AA
MQSFLQNDVKEQSRYNLDIYGLEDKSYEFYYELGSEFFEQMSQELIQKGDFKVHLVLDKSTTMIQLRFIIRGTAELTCDRSLEVFEEPVDTEGKIILKFGDHDEELTEEIAIINRNRTRINVAGYIFELIALALPMKKIHPDLRQQSGGNEDETDSETLVYSSEGSKSEDPETEDGRVDPRWEALNKLKQK